MPTQERAHIERLIATDKLDEALSALGLIVGGDAELAREVTALQGKFARIKRDERRGLVAREMADRTLNEIRHSALELVAASPCEPLTIFISYHHRDGDVAIRLADALGAEGLRVLMDSHSMRAGQGIERFISSSIRKSDVTLCIVSNQSLLSPWVVMEALRTFMDERLSDKRKFVAGYVDPDFLDADFHLKATKRLDQQLAEVDEVITAHIREGIDDGDLVAQRSRLLDLRNNLGKMLGRLRGSLVLDLREKHFAQSVARIIGTLSGREI